MKTFFSAVIVFFIFCFQAIAVPSEIGSSLADARKVGEANYTFLTKKLYKAELWVSNGDEFAIGGRFALLLDYNAKLSAKILSWASVMEIARVENVPQSSLNDLSAKLEACFADVRSGDRITGLAKTKNSAAFYVNGKKSCDVSYPNFRERFFGIWLGPNTRDTKSSAKLKGL